MAVLSVAATMLAAASGDQAIQIIVAVIALGGTGGLYQHLRRRSQERLEAAQTRQQEASADREMTEREKLVQDVYQEVIADLRDELTQLRQKQTEFKDEMLAARAEAAEERASRARGAAALIEAQSEIAMLVAKASEERHVLANEVTALRGENANLKNEVQSLREEIETLRARQGHTERRANARRTD